MAATGPETPANLTSSNSLGWTLRIMPNSSALNTSSTEIGAVVEIAASADAIETASTEATSEPFGRFRRNLGRFRGDANGQDHAESLHNEAELKLQVMLLREENARLKAASRHPSDVATLIDQLRLLGATHGDGEMLDEAWTLLSECLVIREGLEQACIEIQAAISAVRIRLGALAIGIDDVAAHDPTAPDAAATRASLSS